MNAACRTMVACAVAAAGMTARVATCAGDEVRLRSGTRLFGQIEKEGADEVILRTELGSATLRRSDIASIERGPPPWEEYERLRAAAADTLDDHLRLAMWCDAHGLPARGREEYRAVLRHDPQHALARRMVGLDRPEAARSGRAASRPAASAAETPQAKLVRELTTRWHVRVNSIYHGRLESKDPSSKLFQEGRAQILAMRDPLAIPGISTVLARGATAVRLLMIEALSGFQEDEATMNLVAVALFDPEASVRAAAARALVPRKDERVVGRLRRALSSNEDRVVCHAAQALGVLRAREAVEDLATVLYTVERRPVRYARTELLTDMLQTFDGRIAVQRGGRLYYYQPQVISVMQSGTAVGTTWVTEIRDVKQYRTDVQEALIAITGRNFGFDADAWIRWARDHPPGTP